MDIVGISKGRGFRGCSEAASLRAVVPKSHGSMFQITGSIGSSAFPSRVFKGMRMSGHMGDRSRDRTQPARSWVWTKTKTCWWSKAACPGANGGYVVITQSEEAAARAARICWRSATVDPLKAAKRAAKKARGSRGRQSSVIGQATKSCTERHMATIDISQPERAKVGTLDLADEVFGAVNEDLLWEAVKHYRAGQRAGTHATKNQ